MITKIKAAKIATAAGCNLIIAIIGLVLKLINGEIHLSLNVT